MPRPRPLPPRPDLLRRPTGSFGWLDDRLLREGWLSRLGPEAAAVLLLLALAADRHGASFFGRARMASALDLNQGALDRALSKLARLELVDHRPWRPGQADGVWQLLPLPPERSGGPQGQGPVSISMVLQRLGLSITEARIV